MLGRNGRLKTKEGPSREFALRSQYCGHHAIELPWLGSHRTDSRCETAERAWRAGPRRPARVTKRGQILGNFFSRAVASAFGGKENGGKVGRPVGIGHKSRTGNSPR